MIAGCHHRGDEKRAQNRKMALRQIQHAAGPMWGAGLPRDEDVWSSVEYSETDYRDLEGFLIIDSRGKNADGEYWRVLGRTFETASYRKLAKDEAAVLDKVLNGVCLRPQPAQ